MTDTINIGGIPVQVASDAEAEAATFVVCMPVGTPSPWTDNITTSCAFCDRAIIHRPTVPKTPPKICIDCATAATRKPN